MGIVETALATLFFVSFAIGLGYRNLEAFMMKVIVVLDGVVACLATMVLVVWWYVAHYSSYANIVFKFDDQIEMGLQFLVLVNILIYCSPLIGLAVGHWIGNKIQWLANRPIIN